MNFADVYVEVPALVTERVTASDGAEVGPIQAGVVADLGVVPLGSTTLVFTPAFRAWGAGWQGRVDYDLRVFDVAADFGARWSPASEEAKVRAWWGVGSGVRFGYLSADYWEDVVTFGLGAWTGGGVVVGKGKLRPSFSVRGDVMANIGSYDATIVTGEGTSTWSYWPGSARVAVQAGFEFR